MHLLFHKNENFNFHTCLFAADPKSCPNSNYSPENGDMSMTNNVYSYSCLSGYTLDGPDTRTCNTVDGTWTPENEPTCKGMY